MKFTREHLDSYRQLYADARALYLELEDAPGCPVDPVVRFEWHRNQWQWRLDSALNPLGDTAFVRPLEDFDDYYHETYKSDWQPDFDGMLEFVGTDRFNPVKTYVARDESSGNVDLPGAQSMEEAKDIAEDFWLDGSWDPAGGRVDVHVVEIDYKGDEVRNETITVELPVDHERLICDAIAPCDRHLICSTDPDDHDWTRDGEGGCDENPGVWSTGGTSMVYQEHCRRCGLQRITTELGSQRNPGEQDKIEYRLLDEEEIERHKHNLDMD